MDFTPRHVAIAYLWEIIEIRAGGPVPTLNWEDPHLSIKGCIEQRDEFIDEAFRLAVVAMEIAVQAGAASSERALLPMLAERLANADNIRSAGDGSG